MDFKTKWKMLRYRLDFQSTWSIKDECVDLPPLLQTNCNDWSNIKRERKNGKHLHWPEMAMNYKVVSGFKPQVYHVPSLQAYSSNLNFGSYYYVMGTKSTSYTIVDQNQAHCLKPKAGIGFLPLQKRVY